METAVKVKEKTLLRRIFEPLRSRKVRVALATAVAAVLAHYGLAASDELLLGVIGLGASLILGIAHEDAGRKSAPPSVRTVADRNDPDF